MIIAPLYQADGITLYCADWQNIRDLLNADVLVTDPPYGIAYESGRANASAGIVGDVNTSARDELLDWWSPRPAVVFGSWKRARPAATRMLLTWEKGANAGMGDLSIPWKPNTEEIYIIGQGFAGSRTTSVLRHQAPVTWKSGRWHAHQKPIALMGDLIAKCPPGTILDPFAGSGSTLVAARNHNRKAIGVEIDPEHCAKIVARLRQGVLL